jgi:predicted O-methyltransferase YrrM
MSSTFEDLNGHIARHPQAPFEMEGFVTPLQAARIASLIACRCAWRVAEIGFNAGHSALAILGADPLVTLVSFDLGDHPYVDYCAKFVATQFPGRHQLILGDSAQTVPRYADEHADERFDLVIIDGGHTFRAAWADLLNCRRICQPSGVLIMDDLTPEYCWGRKPTEAWERAKAEGWIQEIDRFEEAADGDIPRHVFAVGQYR